jgi:hypothetical protein
MPPTSNYTTLSINLNTRLQPPLTKPEDGTCPVGAAGVPSTIAQIRAGAM